MSGLNVITVQDNIEAYINAQFPNYVVYDTDVPDDDSIIKVGNKIKPYIVLQWGALNSAPNAGSFIGARFDEYYSTVDVAIVAPTARQARVSLNIIVDRLIGWKPTGSSHLSSDGGMGIVPIVNRNGKPNIYIASSRLKYAINADNVGSYITP